MIKGILMFEEKKALWYQRSSLQSRNNHTHIMISYIGSGVKYCIKANENFKSFDLIFRLFTNVTYQQHLSNSKFYA